MAKLTNTSKGDLGLPTGVVIPAGQTVEVDAKDWSGMRALPVVKGWLDAGKLKTGGNAPAKPAEGKSEPKADQKAG